MVTHTDYGILFREIEFGCGSVASFGLAGWFAVRAVVNMIAGEWQVARGQLALATPHFGNWVFFTWVWLISYSRIIGIRQDFDPRAYLYAGYVGIGITCAGVLWAIYEFSPRQYALRSMGAVVGLIVSALLAVHALAFYVTGGHLNLAPIP